MRAVSEYAHYVRQACNERGAGDRRRRRLPLDLPDLTAEFPDVALIPILSDAAASHRAAQVDAQRAACRCDRDRASTLCGRHLGAARESDLGDARFEFRECAARVFQSFEELGIERGRIPLIVAGGIDTHEKFRAALALGASAVQLGTPSPSRPKAMRIRTSSGCWPRRARDIVTFMSVAGWPARRVRTPWLEHYLAKLPVLQGGRRSGANCTLAFDCLEVSVCARRRARWPVLHRPAARRALMNGDVQRGLFFRGPRAAAVRPRNPSVRDLIDYIG